MRKIMFIIVMICGFMLTGCVQMVELTDQESDMITEYMAGVVLKHDANYDNSLTNPEDALNNQEEGSGDVSATNIGSEKLVSLDLKATTDDSDSIKTMNSIELESKEVVKDMDLTEQMGNGDFSITYSDYGLYDSYNNDNNYFTLEASKGRQLLIVTFDIKNLSNKSKKFNLINSDFNYQLDINIGTIYKPMMTLIVNDIQYINLDIAAGETRKAIIVFDVLRNDNTSDVNLIVSNQDKTTILEMK